MARDFTLSRYEALCKTLIFSSYRGQAVEPFVILRHDVDRRAEIKGCEFEDPKRYIIC